MTSEMTAQQSAEFAYRSAWRRRLALVLLGLGLIAFSKGLYVRLCWREWKPLFPEPQNSIAYMGVLRPEATSSSLECIRALEPERRREALMLVPEEGDAFRPIYPKPEEPDNWVDSKLHLSIPAAMLSFEPAAVWAAYPKTKVEHLATHGFADSYRLIKWDDKGEGDYLELGLEKDNAMGPYTLKLTIYTQQGGKVKTAFASTQRVATYEVLTRETPGAMLVNYTNGIAGYRWKGGTFQLDNAVKREYWRDYLGVCMNGSSFVNTWCGPALFMLAVPFWIYRGLKFLWLKICGRPYRKSSRLRGGALGCLTPLFLLVMLVGCLFNSEYFGESLIWSARINQAGWALILIAAAIPNRRESGGPQKSQENQTTTNYKMQ